MKKVAVIGAGLGGLSTAIQLAHAGFDVHVFEKNHHPGGKMRRFSLGSSQFDFGPNTITMPQVFQSVIAQTGVSPDDYFQFIKIDIHTRNHFADGTTFDSSSNHRFIKDQIMHMDSFAHKHFDSYIKEITRLYLLSENYFFPKTFTSWRDYISPTLTKALLSVRPFESMNHFHQRYFKDDRLLQMFNRYATYVGSSPFQAPATFAMIAYLEWVQGVYYVKGGNPCIAEGFAKRAVELGVTFSYGVEVKKIDVDSKKAKRILLANGQLEEIDLVVLNGDLLQVFPNLIEEEDRPSFSRKTIEAFQPSISAFVILASLNKRLDGLVHHQVFFNRSYKDEFSELFDSQQMPSDPTIYICNSSYTDSNVSPDGDNLLILVNAPALSHGQKSSFEKEEYKHKIYKMLAKKGFDLRPHLIQDKIIDPNDIQEHYHAYKGALYGPSSNRKKDAFLRPTNKSKDINNLYFVGGSTHPGGGAPMVTLSGLNVSKMIIENYNK